MNSPVQVPSIPEAESTNLYCFDLWVRSFAEREFMYLLSADFGEADREAIVERHFGGMQLRSRLYIKTRDVFLNQVKLKVGGAELPLDTCFFHYRFGWVVGARGHRAFLGKCSLIEGTTLSIGRRSYLSGGCTLRGGGKISIGSYCAFGENLCVLTAVDNHNLDFASNLPLNWDSRLKYDGLSIPLKHHDFRGPLPVEIGNDVWFGRNVTITAGAKLGDCCAVGQKSLVRSGEWPAATILAGTPARHLRDRFSPAGKAAVLASAWWEWTDEELQQRASFFETNFRE